MRFASTAIQNLSPRMDAPRPCEPPRRHRRLAADVLSWYQRPMFKTHIGGFVELQTTTPQVSPAIMRKLTEYFPSPELNFPLDPSFEDTNSPDAKYKLCSPYAKAENIKKFKDLQALQSIGLVTPNNAAFMYYAAMESKSCKLTPLGVHYWKLVKENKI